MFFKDEVRSFFVLYSNGEVFNFNINTKGEIYCREFLKLYGNNMPVAYSVEFTENSFNLQDAFGEKILSLEEFKSTLSCLETTLLSISTKLSPVERLYIDEDVRKVLLGTEKIKCDTESCSIPGLLYEPVETKHSRSKHK